MSLHPNQEKLLKLLASNIDTPLTIRQLKEELNIDSAGLVHHHIVQLEKKGYLKRDPGNPSNYKVLRDPEAPIGFANLYGMAKCGPDGTLLSGDPIERIPISSRLIHFPMDEAFLVKADGDSMEPEIRDGDLVICQEKKEAKDGDIIVCTYQEIVRIKRLREIGDQEYVLESANNKYGLIPIKNPNEFFIEGIYKGLIRR